MIGLIQTLGGLQALSHLPQILEEHSDTYSERDSKRRSIRVEEGSVLDKLTAFTYLWVSGYLLFKLTKTMSRKHRYVSGWALPGLASSRQDRRLNKQVLYGEPGHEQFFVNDDGLVLRLTWWSRREHRRRGLVLLVHGLGEHCGLYTDMAEQLCKCGYDVVGFDLQGHGKSEGTRLFCRKFQDHVEDVICFVRLMALSVRSRGEHEKIFLFGHSMGALLAVFAATHTTEKHLEGVILSSPLVGQNSKTTTGLLSSSFVKWCYRCFGDTLPQLAPFHLGVSYSVRSPLVRDLLRNDPLRVETRVTCRLGSELLLAQQDFDQALAIVLETMPLYVIYGKCDWVVPNMESHMKTYFAERPNVHLVAVDDAWHDLWFDSLADVDDDDDAHADDVQEDKLTQDVVQEDVPKEQATIKKRDVVQGIVQWMNAKPNRHDPTSSLLSSFGKTYDRLHSIWPSN